MKRMQIGHLRAQYQIAAGPMLVRIVEIVGFVSLDKSLIAIVFRELVDNDICVAILYKTEAGVYVASEVDIIGLDQHKAETHAQERLQCV